MRIGPMRPDEALAIARLRQWAYDRVHTTTGRTASYERDRLHTRKLCGFDAAIVRVIDFDRALATLDADEQAALILTYRDRQKAEHVAQALACSTRKLGYMLPTARQKLATELDRLNLL